MFASHTGPAFAAAVACPNRHPVIAALVFSPVAVAGAEEAVVESCAPYSTRFSWPTVAEPVMNPSTRNQAPRGNAAVVTRTVPVESSASTTPAVVSFTLPHVPAPAANAAKIVVFAVRAVGT